MKVYHLFDFIGIICFQKFYAKLNSHSLCDKIITVFDIYDDALIMNLFLNRILFVVPFLLSFSCSATIDSKLIGTPVDESFIYKTQKTPKTIADKSNDVFSVLNRIDQKLNKSEKTLKKQSSKDSKVFTLKTVNGDDITNIDVVNVIKLMFLFSGKEYNQSVAKLMVPTVLESLEDDKLRQQCANLFKIVISKKDIDEKISDIASGNGVSIDQLAQKFEEFGISMNVFRANIKSKLIFQIIAQSFSEGGNVSSSEIAEERNNELALINSSRYCVSEIFRYDEESANEVLKLIKKGFNFQILAENFSQKICPGKDGFLKWMKIESIEPEVLNRLKSMTPGECSPVIKTKAGYKIVCLLDKADPGKAGTMDSDYKILKASFKYRGKLFTQQDLKKSENQLNEFMSLSSIDAYKDFCQKHSIEYKETEISHPDPYHMELVNRSKFSKKPAALQSLDDDDSVNVVMFISETAPNATLPNDKALKEAVAEKKAEESFTRNFKRLKSSSHIDEKTKNIERMFS